MTKLTPEKLAEIEQTGEAVKAALRGEPWEYQVANKWKTPTICSVGFCLNSGNHLRPAPAPPKPWDINTLPPLPFEVRKGKERYTVTYADDCAIYVAGWGETTYHALLEGYTLPDGSPCGVKEVK